MTPRQIIDAAMLRVWLAWGLGTALLVIALFPIADVRGAEEWLLAIAVSLWLLAGLIYRRRVICPSCRRHLGLLTALSHRLSPKYRHCVFCGASLDSPPGSRSKPLDHDRSAPAGRNHRAELDRHMFRANLQCFLGLSLFISGLFGYCLFGLIDPSFRERWAFLAIVVAGAVLAYRGAKIHDTKLVCPACGGGLSVLRGRIVLRLRLAPAHRWCVHCGVPFDANGEGSEDKP